MNVGQEQTVDIGVHNPSIGSTEPLITMGVTRADMPLMNLYSLEGMLRALDTQMTQSFVATFLKLTETQKQVTALGGLPEKIAALDRYVVEANRTLENKVESVATNATNVAAAQVELWTKHEEHRRESQKSIEARLDAIANAVTRLNSFGERLTNLQQQIDAQEKGLTKKFDAYIVTFGAIVKADMQLMEQSFGSAFNTLSNQVTNFMNTYNNVWYRRLWRWMGGK